MNLKQRQGAIFGTPGVHDSERAKTLGVSGRYSDLAFNWFCHQKLHEIIDSGKTSGKDLAKDTGIPAAAISHSMKNAAGMGFAALDAMAKLCGFTRRGAFLEHVDAWWEREGKDYALRITSALAKERGAIIKGDSAGDGDDPGQAVRRRKRAHRGKAKQLFQGSDDNLGRRGRSSTRE